MIRRYSGRDFTEQDIELINNFISTNPDKHRLAISQYVSKELNWQKRDGGFSEMSCRVALLRMHRDEVITLPPPRGKNGNGKIYSKRTLFCEPKPMINISSASFNKIEFEIVRKNTFQANLWNEFIDRYHYLGHKTLPGAQLRYYISHNDQPIAMFGFSAAAWTIAPRDKLIGWSDHQRKKNLHLVVNNSRFLILPWISSKHLASKLLSIAAKRLPRDWKERYGYSPVLLETFVEDIRFKGTCYKAANWCCLGKTTGRGRNEKSQKQVLPIKSIWTYPLHKKFKYILSSSD